MLSPPLSLLPNVCVFSLGFAVVTDDVDTHAHARTHRLSHSCTKLAAFTPSSSSIHFKRTLLTGFWFFAFGFWLFFDISDQFAVYVPYFEIWLAAFYRYFYFYYAITQNC